MKKKSVATSKHFYRLHHALSMGKPVADSVADAAVKY
jgi:hypothetical protein